MILDRVEVRDLLLRCIIGINPEERVNLQDVLINLTMFADITKAGTSDDIADAINYKTCLLYTSPSPRDRTRSRMPSSA